MNRSILSPEFRYTPSSSTDLRKTFARERKRLKELSEREQANQKEADRKVKPIVRAKS